MAPTTESIARYLGRHRFAVLGYSAEDDVYCPECLRRGAGLSPHRLDSRGRPILPLFLADPTVREEVCCHCERLLTDALPGIQAPTLFRVVRLRHTPGSTVLQRLPVGSLAIDSLGRGSLYLDVEDEPIYVAREPTSSDATTERARVPARPPIIRRRVPAAR